MVPVKLGIKQMLPLEKNREILLKLLKAQPAQAAEVLRTLRTVRWEGPKRDDLMKLIQFVQELERTGTVTDPVDREIDQVRRAFIDQRRKPL